MSIETTLQAKHHDYMQLISSRHEDNYRNYWTIYQQSALPELVSFYKLLQTFKWSVDLILLVWGFFGFCDIIVRFVAQVKHKFSP